VYNRVSVNPSTIYTHNLIRMTLAFMAYDQLVVDRGGSAGYKSSSSIDF